MPRHLNDTPSAAAGQATRPHGRNGLHKNHGKNPEPPEPRAVDVLESRIVGNLVVVGTISLVHPVTGEEQVELTPGEAEGGFPGVYILSAEGGPSAVLACDSAGCGYLDINNARGRTLVSAFVDGPTGRAWVTDHAGNVVGQLPPNSQPEKPTFAFDLTPEGFQLRDPQGRVRLEFQDLGENGPSCFRMRNRAGVVIAEMGEPEGELKSGGYVLVNNAEGTTTGVLRDDGECGGSLEVNAPDGVTKAAVLANEPPHSGSVELVSRAEDPKKCPAVVSLKTDAHGSFLAQR